MSRTNLVIAGALVVIAASQSAAQQIAATNRGPASAGTAGQSVTATLLPGTYPGVVATIRGDALDSLGKHLANTPVRLRDARVGRIVGTQLTDAKGTFDFPGLEPGSYIVEIMGDDQTVLAASQLINVNAGDTVAAVVKLAFRIPPFAGLLGNSTASAVAIIAQALASGVLVTKVSGQPVSPGPQ